MPVAICGPGIEPDDIQTYSEKLAPSGKLIAAVSVSGPIERLTRSPGRLHAPAVLAAAERLSDVLRRSGNPE